MTRHVLLYLAVALVVSLAVLALFLTFPALFLTFPAGGCDAPLCGPMQTVWWVS